MGLKVGGWRNGNKAISSNLKLNLKMSLAILNFEIDKIKVTSK